MYFKNIHYYKLIKSGYCRQNIRFYKKKTSYKNSRIQDETETLNAQ